MNLFFDRSLESFVHHSESLLLEREAQNSLMFAVCARTPRTTPGKAPLLVRVENEGATKLAGYLNPLNHSLLLSHERESSESPIPAIAVLAQALAVKGVQVRSVRAPEREAGLFAQVWNDATRQTLRPDAGHAVYSLSGPLQSESGTGSLRTAERSETGLLSSWMDTFSTERRSGASSATLRQVEQMIHERVLFVWEHEGKPVGMAGSWARTPNGARISAVFVAPPYRGRGFAKLLVTAISQRFLSKPGKFCFLECDPADAAASAVYRSVGYELVGRSETHRSSG